MIKTIAFILVLGIMLSPTALAKKPAQGVVKDPRHTVAYVVLNERTGALELKVIKKKSSNKDKLLGFGNAGSGMRLLREV